MCVSVSTKSTANPEGSEVYGHQNGINLIRTQKYCF